MSEADRSNVHGSVYFETSRSLAGIYGVPTACVFGITTVVRLRK
jgi:hypothetical protein